MSLSPWPGLSKGSGLSYQEGIGGPGLSDQGGIVITYHIDSRVAVSGDGSLASPFKLPADLPTLVEGDVIGVARGSSYGAGENIVSTVNSITLTAYGDTSDPRPDFDGEGTEPLCISLTGDYVRIYSIVAHGATANDGCIIAGHYCLVQDCEAYDGGLHTALVASGTVRRLNVHDGSGASLLEFFTNRSGQSLVLEDVTAGLAVYDAGVAAIDGHTDGLVTYDRIVIRRPVITNTGSGISGGDYDRIEVVSPIFSGVLSALSLSGDALVTDMVDTGGVATGKSISITQPNLSVVIDGLTVCRDDFNTSMISCGQPGLNFLLKGRVKIGSTNFSAFSVFFFDFGTIQFGEIGDQWEIGVRNASPAAGVPYYGIIGRGANDAVVTTPASFTVLSETFQFELNGVTKNNLSEISANPPTGFGLMKSTTVGSVTACS